MELKFFCPHCTTKISADSDAGGEDVVCPNSECSKLITAPMSIVGPGTALGAFRVISKLGSGGMGEVYLAEQQSLNRQVALKVLFPEVTTNDMFLKHFRSEVAVQGSLHHPNIATAYDAGEDRGVHYLAMEFVDGQPLEDIIKERGPLDQEEALSIARQVAEGLEYAWKKSQIVHRDIKPGNIMLSNSGQVKILDLGLSKSLIEHDSAKTQHLLGTPQFMSPEQARGKANLDFRGDIYSLGGTIYAMLTCIPPQGGASITEVVEKQLSASIQPPSELNPKITVGCENLIIRTMQKDPLERFSSWDKFIESVDLVLHSNQPIERRSSGSVTSNAVSSTTLSASTASSPTASSSSDRKVVSQANIPWLMLIPAFLLLAVAIFFSTSNKDEGAINGTANGAINGTANGSTKVSTNVSEPDPLLVVPNPVDPATNSTSGLVQSGTGSGGGAEVLNPEALDPEGGANIPAALIAFRETKLSNLFAYAESQVIENPDELDTHILNFERVKKDGESLGDFVMVLKAERRIQALRDERSDRIEQARKSLELEFNQLFDAKEYDEALAILKNPKLPHADQYSELILSLAEKAKVARHEVALATVAAQKYFDESLQRIASSIIEERGLSELAGIFKSIEEDPSGELIQESLDDVKAYIQSSVRCEKLVFASFEEDIGRKVLVGLRNETPKEVEIVTTTEDQVHWVRAYEGGTAGAIYTLSDLSDAEIYKRIKSQDPDRAELWAGLNALKAIRLIQARDHFSKVNHVIGGALLKELERNNDLSSLTLRNIPSTPRNIPSTPGNIPADGNGGVEGAEDANGKQLSKPNAEGETLRDELEAVFSSAGLKVFPLTREDLSEWIETAEPSSSVLNRLNVDARHIAQKFRGSEDLIPYSGHLKEIFSRKTYRQVSAEDLHSALRTANPGYNGNAQIRFSEDGLTMRVDLSGAGSLSYLAVLEGLPIVELSLSGRNIQNLKPLVGMPLKKLLLHGTGVKKLTALRGAPLESLSLLDSGDLRTLAGIEHLPLSKLNLQGTSVVNYRALRNLPLKMLICSRDFKDLSAIQDLPIRTLRLDYSKVVDLKPLARMEQLEAVSFLKTNVSDVTPLEECERLKSVTFTLSRITSGLDVLKTIPGLRLRQDLEAPYLDATTFFEQF